MYSNMYTQIGIVRQSRGLEEWCLPLLKLCCLEDDIIIKLTMFFLLISVMVVVTFSSLAWILGECSIIYSPPVLCFTVGISLRTLIPLFYARISPQWLSKLRRLWPAECSLTSWVWTRFRIGSHTMPGQRHSQSTPTSLGQRWMFRCNLLPALWQNDWGLLYATVVT